MRPAPGAGCSSSPTSLTAWSASTRSSRCAGGGWSERDVDEAAGAVGVLGPNARQPRACGRAARAARWSCRGAARRPRAGSPRPRRDRGSCRARSARRGHRRCGAAGAKPEGRQRVVQRVGDRAVATIGCDLAADLATGGLDVLETAAGPDGAREPPAELLEGLRAAAGRARGRGDGPLLARAAARLRDVAALEQPDVGEPLQLDAHAVGMAGDRAASSCVVAGRRSSARAPGRGALGSTGRGLSSVFCGMSISARAAASRVGDLFP